MAKNRTLPDQDMHASSKLVSLRESAWKELCLKIVTIALTGINSLSHYNLVRKFIPMPQAMKIPYAKAAVDKEWEKLEKLRARQMTKVRSKKKVSSKKAQKEGRQFILLRHWTSAQKTRSWNRNSKKIQRTGCSPR